MSKACAVCAGEAHLVCSGCKRSRYCSKDCQLVDWRERGHKNECKVLQNRPPRPPTERCTGCGVRFSKDYGCTSSCPDCGYRACESCVCHNSRGTCYCLNSNFGNPYCRLHPQYYHADGHTGKMYTGDRHPPVVDWEQFTEEDYDPEPRMCGNCGEVKKMLKHEFTQTPRYYTGLPW